MLAVEWKGWCKPTCAKSAGRTLRSPVCDSESCCLQGCRLSRHECCSGACAGFSSELQAEQWAVLVMMGSASDYTQFMPI